MTLWLLLACAPGPTPLTVLAASSLTEAFQDLERSFEADHPGVDVQLVFAGSQALATQVRHGLRAEVLASADALHVEALVAEGLAEAPSLLARNRLVLARPAGAAGPRTLAELPGVERLLLGGEEVPAGRYADALLDAASATLGESWREAVQARVASREPNVRLVLARLAMGEADAALVYATDVAAVEGVAGAPLPEGLIPDPEVWQVRLVGAPRPALAEAWVEHAASPEARALLAARGFLPPP